MNNTLTKKEQGIFNNIHAKSGVVMLKENLVLLSLLSFDPLQIRWDITLLTCVLV